MGLLDPIIDMASAFYKGYRAGQEKVEREKRELDRLLAETRMEMELALAKARAEEERRKREDYMFLLPRVEGMLAFMIRDGIHVSPAVALLEKAKNSFDRSSYVEAYDLLRKAEKKAHEIMEFYQKAPRYISSAAEAIKTAKKRGVKLETAEELLSDAEQKFRQGSYQEACELADQARSITKKLDEFYTKSSKLISSVEKKLSTLREEGIHTAKVEDVLSKARAAFGRGEYEEAYRIAKDAERRAGSLKKYIVKAMSTISVAEKRLKDASSKIKAPQAEEYLSKARRAFDGGEYESAYTLAEEAIVEIERAEEAYNEASRVIRSAEQAIHLLSDITDDTKPASLLDNAKSAFDAHEYEKAFELAEKAKNLSFQIKQAYNEIENAKSTISTLEESRIGSIKLRLSRAKSICDEAQNKFKNGDYETAMALAIKAGKKARALIYVLPAYLIFIVILPLGFLYSISIAPIKSYIQKRWEEKARAERLRAEIIRELEGLVNELEDIAGRQRKNELV